MDQLLFAKPSHFLDFAEDRPYEPVGKPIKFILVTMFQPVKMAR
jgi:hypothetical protein